MACIRKRRNRWVIDFYDQNGKRRWKTLSEGTTKTEARSSLLLIESAVERGSYVSPSRMPSFAEITDSWLDAKKPNLRHSTFQQYKGHVENHLKPFFGSMKINRISYDTVENFLAKSYDQGVIIPTLRKILVNLGAIINYACRKRFIDYNPVRDVEKPKVHSEHKTNSQVDVLSPEQIRLLFETTAQPK